ncbi:MAG: DUF2802 domain-containing protein [Rhodocyclaceae bacterium]|nr:DUF2802 domain-containing protein [Rhodocyclaceae bacterium]MBX3669082.1 DUF2802 domain-containing protein [Rhodocyclaceae bacterium]
MTLDWKVAAFVAVAVLAVYLGYSLYRLSQSAARGAAPEAPPAPAPELALRVDELARELAELRELVAASQQNCADLQEQIDRLRQTQGTAPQYAEALVLARQGLHAEQIAERCGVAVAEAELLLALARGESQA